MFNNDMVKEGGWNMTSSGSGPIYIKQPIIWKRGRGEGDKRV